MFFFRFEGVDIFLIFFAFVCRIDRSFSVVRGQCYWICNVVLVARRSGVTARRRLFDCCLAGLQPSASSVTAYCTSTYDINPPRVYKVARTTRRMVGLCPSQNVRLSRVAFGSHLVSSKNHIIVRRSPTVSARDSVIPLRIIHARAGITFCECYTRHSPPHVFRTLLNRTLAKLLYYYVRDAYSSGFVGERVSRRKEGEDAGERLTFSS